MRLDTSDAVAQFLNDPTGLQTTAFLKGKTGTNSDKDSLPSQTQAPLNPSLHRSPCLGQFSENPHTPYPIALGT